MNFDEPDSRGADDGQITRCEAREMAANAMSATKNRPVESITDELARVLWAILYDDVDNHISTTLHNQACTIIQRAQGRKLKAPALADFRAELAMLTNGLNSRKVGDVWEAFSELERAMERGRE